jgi:hypothetical protein
MMDQWEEVQRKAAERLGVILDRPLFDDPQMGDADDFDPWDIFNNTVYGSYSSHFDKLAIACLEGVRDRLSARETAAKHDMPELAVEMLYEMLCCADLCEYGSSPRIPWVTAHAKPMWQPLIDKWKAYSSLQWDADAVA